MRRGRVGSARCSSDPSRRGWCRCSPACSCSRPAPAGGRRLPRPPSPARGRRVRCSNPCAPPAPTIARRPLARPGSSARRPRAAASRRRARPRLRRPPTATQQGLAGKAPDLQLRHRARSGRRRAALDGPHPRAARERARGRARARARGGARARAAAAGGRLRKAGLGEGRAARPGDQRALRTRRAGRPPSWIRHASRARPPACRREAGPTPRICRWCAAAWTPTATAAPRTSVTSRSGTDELLRREEDRDLDGNTDTWTRYERGVAVERVLDSERRRASGRVGVSTRTAA